MADRYWVGGPGTWNTTTTTNWSATSGGSGGAAVPTNTDSVFFDQAMTYTVTCTGNLACLDFISAAAGKVTFATGTTPTFNISGSMSLSSETVWSSTGKITFNATTTGKTITTNGVTFSSAVEFNGVGGEWTLGSAFTSGAFTLAAGNFVANNFAVTFPNFISTSASVRGLNLGNSLVTVTLGGTSTIWNVTNTANLSVTGTSTISCTASTGKVFSGGSGVAYYNIDQGGAGYLQIAGTAIFNDIQNSYVATGETSIRIQGSPITVANFTATGAEGKAFRLSSSSGGTTKILTKTGGGIVSVDYMAIQDINATGTSATWYAGANSVDQGNNTGWIFSGVPSLLARLLNTGIFKSNNTISLDEVSPYVIRNLLIYTQQFDLWNLGLDVSIVANATLAPDNTLTADSIESNISGSVVHNLYRSYSTTTTGNYCLSVYLKQNTGTLAVVRLQDLAVFGGHCVVNLATGVISSTSGEGYVSSNITNVGNNWYRVSIVVAFSSALTQLQSQIFLNNYGSSTDPGSIYAWGAQLEEGTSASSYQGIGTAGVILNPEAPSKVNITGIYSTEFDEITQTAVPMRILQNGNMQVSGSFDEVTGMIVTDGLAAYYDAGLAESQSSTGIWHDISDFGIPVDPSISPPTYDSSGYFIFDRVNTQRFQLDALNITSWTDPWTIEAWMFTPTSATWGNGTTNSHFISVGSTGGSWGLIRSSVNNRVSAWLRYDAITNAANATLSRDVWNQVVAMWDPVLSILRIYVNGQFVSSDVVVTPTGVPDTSLMSIGGANNTLSGSPGIFYEGNIAAVILYNKALSSAEVGVNFQALRNRFGI